MPSQIKIITAVNRCLRQMKRIEFQLDSNGVCNGLSGLFIKYTLENKTHTFFQLLDKLSELPPEYKTGKDSVLDNFITQIETAYNTHEYQQNLLQSDIDKVLYANGKPFENEYNIGLITNQMHWEKILMDISKPNRAYFVGSTKHAIGFVFKNNKYTLYDPNYKVHKKRFDNPKDLLSEIKECFDFKDKEFGMSIRVFAPKGEHLFEYPEKSTIHSLVFKRLSKDDNSYVLACDAKDTETLDYLRQHKAINWNNLGSKLIDELLINQLLKEVPSKTQQRILLDMITFNFWHAYSNNLTRLLDYYTKHYTQKSLKESLENFLEYLPTLDMQGPIIKKARDYSSVLKLANLMGLNKNSKLLTVLTHLHFLTLQHAKAENNDYELLISSHTPADLIKQIQLAAFANHNQAMDILLKKCAENKINPANYPSIFSKELFETISPYLLEKLQASNFPIDLSNSELAMACANRKERKIFEVYLSVAAKNDANWHAIKQNDVKKVDLKLPPNRTNYLHVLILLGKNDLIKAAWKDNFTTKELMDALDLAIKSNNNDISHFLIMKIKNNDASTYTNNLESWLDIAIHERNLDALDMLSKTPDFILLKDENNIDSILWICSIHNNFGPVEKSFDSATKDAQLLVLERCLTYNYQAFFEKKLKQSPNLFGLLLDKWIPSQDENRDFIISKIDTLIGKWFSEGNLAINLQDKNIKPFIDYCFTKNHLELIKNLFTQQYYEDNELATLYSELVAKKCDKGLDFLLNHSFNRIKIDPSQLAILAVQKNNPVLLSTLINLETQSLEPFIPELLAVAAQNGHYEVIQTIAQNYPCLYIDYKALFVLSCEHKQAKLANALLGESFVLDSKTRQKALLDLFGSQASEQIYQTVYSEGHGRLYGILLQQGVESPQSALLDSIKDPFRDTGIQDTPIFEPIFNALLNTLDAKDTHLFQELFTHLYSSYQLNKPLLKLLEYPFFTKDQYRLITTKFPEEDLLEYALESGSWVSVANLLKEISEKDCNPYLKCQIDDNCDAIVLAYLTNLQKNYTKRDIRPILYDYLTPSNNPSILSSLLNSKKDWIEEVIIKVQDEMQKANKPLKRTYKITLNKGQGIDASLQKLSKPTPNPIPSIPGKQKYCAAVRDYLDNRDKTLSIFSYYCDYYRGKIRAEHYNNLIKNARTSQELHLIIFAIITNPNGQYLQKNTLKALGCTNKEAAIDKLCKLIGSEELYNKQSDIYQCAASINKKANALDTTSTETLFKSERETMRTLFVAKSQSNQSFFKPVTNRKPSLLEKITTYIHFKN